MFTHLKKIIPLNYDLENLNKKIKTYLKEILHSEKNNVNQKTNHSTDSAPFWIIYHIADTFYGILTSIDKGWYFDLKVDIVFRQPSAPTPPALWLCICTALQEPSR